MTLVVSEVTRYGIAMVGDSAVTVRGDGPAQVYSGAAKVQYCSAANVGFAIWGAACVAGQPMDTWLASFCASLGAGLALPEVAARLATDLNAALGPVADWNKERRGIHVAGYVDGLPHLYHVHTGDEGAPQHELRVFRDYPYLHVQTIAEYECRLRYIGGYHLRNGFYGMFGLLFDAIYGYTEALKRLRFTWPDRGIEDRVQLYALLVQLVGDTLVAEGMLAAVGGPITAIAFTEKGLVVDKAGVPGGATFPCGQHAEF